MPIFAYHSQRGSGVSAGDLGGERVLNTMARSPSVRDAPIVVRLPTRIPIRSRAASPVATTQTTGGLIRSGWRVLVCVVVFA